MAVRKNLGGKVSSFPVKFKLPLWLSLFFHNFLLLMLSGIEETPLVFEGAKQCNASPAFLGMMLNCSQAVFRGHHCFVHIVEKQKVIESLNHLG